MSFILDILIHIKEILILGIKANLVQKSFVEICKYKNEKNSQRKIPKERKF